MEKELKRVYITQDDSGHDYVIPYELKDEFNELINKMASIFEADAYDLQDEFEDKFGEYATRGDINLIELYARI